MFKTSATVITTLSGWCNFELFKKDKLTIIVIPPIYGLNDWKILQQLMMTTKSLIICFIKLLRQKYNCHIGVFSSNEFYYYHIDPQQQVQQNATHIESKKLLDNFVPDDIAKMIINFGY